MYWFFSYIYTRRGQEPRWLQSVSEIHPLLWQLETEEKYDDGSYEVMFFKEINGDLYHKVKDCIG